MSNLKYFTSVDNKNPEELARTFEDILQREHNSDGSHPTGSTSNSGFITPELVQKIEQMWIWFEEQRSKG